MRTCRPLAALLVAAALAAPAEAQVAPVWDQGRHLLIVVSPLDSADAYAAVTRAFEGEGLVVEHSDTLHGRISSAFKPSDTYGGARASVRYLALVHRATGGGSEIWVGGLIRMWSQPITGSADAIFNSRAHSETNQRPEGDVFFVGPSGNSMEWIRLSRIADAAAHATR